MFCQKHMQNTSHILFSTGSKAASRPATFKAEGASFNLGKSMFMQRERSTKKNRTLGQQGRMVRQ